MISLFPKYAHHKNYWEKIKMKNEILEEIWKIKNKIAEEHNFNIDSIAKNLIEKQKKHKKNIVNYSKKIKKMA